MASRYTDVDQMLLKRWDEVKALRGAFDDLIDRMQDVVESTLQQVDVIATERGWTADSNVKRPSIWFWKDGWENRRKEPAIYFELFDFAPEDYGKDVGEYPSMWLMTDEFSRLKFRESSDEFGRVLRGALSPDTLRKWSHDEVDLSESPLGRDCREISESDRVRLVSDAEALEEFVIERLDEFMELVPTIDQALQTLTRR